MIYNFKIMMQNFKKKSIKIIQILKSSSDDAYIDNPNNFLHFIYNFMYKSFKFIFSLYISKIQFFNIAIFYIYMYHLIIGIKPTDTYNEEPFTKKIKKYENIYQPKSNTEISLEIINDTNVYFNSIFILSSQTVSEKLCFYMGQLYAMNKLKEDLFILGNCTIKDADIILSILNLNFDSDSRFKKANNYTTISIKEINKELFYRKKKYIILSQIANIITNNLSLLCIGQFNCNIECVDAKKSYNLIYDIHVKNCNEKINLISSQTTTNESITIKNFISVLRFWVSLISMKLTDKEKNCYYHGFFLVEWSINLYKKNNISIMNITEIMKDIIKQTPNIINHFSPTNINDHNIIMGFRAIKNTSNKKDILSKKYINILKITKFSDSTDFEMQNLQCIYLEPDFIEDLYDNLIKFSYIIELQQEEHTKSIKSDIKIKLLLSMIEKIKNSEKNFALVEIDKIMKTVKSLIGIKKNLQEIEFDVEKYLLKDFDNLFETILNIPIGEFNNYLTDYNNDIDLILRDLKNPNTLDENICPKYKENFEFIQKKDFKDKIKILENSKWTEIKKLVNDFLFCIYTSEQKKHCKKIQFAIYETCFYIYYIKYVSSIILSLNPCNFNNLLMKHKIRIRFYSLKLIDKSNSLEKIEIFTKNINDSILLLRQFFLIIHFFCKTLMKIVNDI